MNTYQHPAHTMPFDELLANLETEVAARNVNAKDGPNGLRMYSYSDRCVYERAWNAFSLMARGLILDPANRKIVATPFVKFFNYGERPDQIIPDEPFEVFEKLDGSLIIIYHHAGKWNAATRGSFSSDQAKWAQGRLDSMDAHDLMPGATYLAEAVYPENRVVVSYSFSGLVWLSAFHADGDEFFSDSIKWLGGQTGMHWAKIFPCESVSELLQKLPQLTGNEEGFVLRFASGLRLKFKGDEYRRLHKCIAGVTPLALWEAMKARADIEAMRRDIPEEFWEDFDSICGLLARGMASLLREVSETYGRVATLSDKELGLTLNELPANVRGFMFAFRKTKGAIGDDPRAYAKLMDAIRPTGNRLDGYRASSAMSRVQAEE